MPTHFDHSHRAPRSTMIEPLESRLLLSADPWGVQGTQIFQGEAAINFPAITGKGETVAVIDSGVDYTNPVLGGGFGNGYKVIGGYNYMEHNSNPYPVDLNPHGTVTAEMIAGNGFDYEGSHYQGIAPDAHILAFRVALRSDGAKLAMDWILRERIRYNIVAIEVLLPTVPQDARELRTLNAAGVFIGHPSGNSGPTSLSRGMLGVVQSGSVNAEDQVSTFTQRGPNLDMLAPGENVIVAYTYGSQYIDSISSGTSWASPQIVGAAMLIKQVDPTFNEAQVLQILQQTGTPVYDSVTNLTYPLLNLNAALTQAKHDAKRLQRAKSRTAADAAVPDAATIPPAGSLFAPAAATLASAQDRQSVLFNEENQPALLEWPAGDFGAEPIVSIPSPWPKAPRIGS